MKNKKNIKKVLTNGDTSGKIQLVAEGHSKTQIKPQQNNNWKTDEAKSTEKVIENTKKVVDKPKNI